MDKLITEQWANIFSQKHYHSIYEGSRYSEAISSFAEPGLASGKILTISTPDITLNRFMVVSEQKLVMIDQKESEEISSVFSLSGGIESRFRNISGPVNILERSHSFQYSTNFQGEHILHNNRFDAYSITYQHGFFRSLLQTSESFALDQLSSQLEKKQDFILSPTALVLQPRMEEVILALENNSFQGLTRYLFIEAKLLELFALQIDHMSQISRLGKKDEISRAEQEKLKALKSFVEANYLQPLTLSDLCRQFGLNDFKLKKGFRQLFHTTVFGYIHQLRMQKARELLLNKSMLVSEIAFHIGYQNVSSFSAEFKKRFGYSPSKLC